MKKKRKSVNLIKISNFNFKFLDIDPCIFVQLVFTTYIWLNLCSKFSFYYSRPFSSLNKGWYTNYVEKILKIFNPLPLVDKHRHLVMPPLVYVDSHQTFSLNLLLDLERFHGYDEDHNNISNSNQFHDIVRIFNNFAVIFQWKKIPIKNGFRCLDTRCLWYIQYLHKQAHDSPSPLVNKHRHNNCWS